MGPGERWPGGDTRKLPSGCYQEEVHVQRGTRGTPRPGPSRAEGITVLGKDYTTKLSAEELLI